MKKHMFILPVLVAATLAQAEPPVPQAAPGEIILEQHTHTRQGTTGTVTTRYLRVVMKMSGTDRVVSTQPFDNTWTINEGEMRVKADALADSRTMDQRGVGSSQPCLGRRRIDGAALGKKVEEGANITGEWLTRQCDATSERPPWTERDETWYRIDVVDGQKILRPHRREVSSQYEHRRVDYIYVMSERLHTSLFDPSLP